MFFSDTYEIDNGKLGLFILELFNQLNLIEKFIFVQKCFFFFLHFVCYDLTYICIDCCCLIPKLYWVIQETWIFQLCKHVFESWKRNSTHIGELFDIYICLSLYILSLHVSVYLFIYFSLFFPGNSFCSMRKIVINWFCLYFLYLRFYFQHRQKTNCVLYLVYINAWYVDDNQFRFLYVMNFFIFGFEFFSVSKNKRNLNCLSIFVTNSVCYFNAPTTFFV